MGHPTPPATALDRVSMSLAAAVAIVVVGLAHAPIHDDAYHVNAIVSTMEHSELPLLSFDGLHGDPSAPIQQLVHRPQTHEVLVATLAWLSGLDPKTVYWLVFPALGAVLTIVGTWLLAALVAPRAAWVAVWTYLVVALSWGDSFLAWGGYTIVRLFEGKAVFIAALVPILVHLSVRFSAVPTRRHALALMGGACTSALVTSSALVLAPLTCGLALLAASRGGRAGWITLGRGASTLAPLLVVLVWMRAEVSTAGGLAIEGWVRPFDTMFGASARAPIALAVLAALPALAAWTGRARGPFLARYVTLAFLVVLGGLLPAWVAQAVAPLFSWRTYWAVPVPALVAIAGAIAIERGLDARPRRGGWLVLGLLGLLVFAGVGRRTHELSHVTSRWWSHRVRAPELTAAREVVRRAGPDDLVLADPMVAEVIAGFPGRPKLVAVRELYLVNLARHWGEDETRRRMRLLMFTTGELRRLRALAPGERTRVRLSVFDRDSVDPAAELRRAAEDLRDLPIRMVVVRHGFDPVDEVDDPGLTDGVDLGLVDGPTLLESAGFVPVHSTGKYALWWRDDAAMPAGESPFGSGRGPEGPPR